MTTGGAGNPHPAPHRAEVGEGLRGRLRDGFSVLVHCKGGLGRAGTIASRLVVELGTSPGEAVLAVRHARPGAIETREQHEYVLALSEAPEAAPDIRASRSRCLRPKV